MQQEQTLAKENIPKAVEVAREGRYIYGIIGTDEEKTFGPIGIGERGDEVYTLCHEGIAAIISNSSVIKYPITRKNTMAHQKILEEAMKSYTVLPVRFSTMAEGKNGLTAEERTREKVLQERKQEFEELLAKMHNKAELGLKAIWTDMKEVFKEIVDDDSQIKKLREKIISKSKNASHNDKVHLGELVKKALDSKKGSKAIEIMDVLKRCSLDFRTNKVFGDSMIVNAAFLVEKNRIDEFDARVNELSAGFGDTIKFKYVGPVPPCNFVEIVIHWE